MTVRTPSGLKTYHLIPRIASICREVPVSLDKVVDAVAARPSIRTPLRLVELRQGSSEIRIRKREILELVAVQRVPQTDWAGRAVYVKGRRRSRVGQRWG